MNKIKILFKDISTSIIDQDDKKLGFIQALRALAATLVIAYHYPGGIYKANCGYIGVDMFFVIAGFIMVMTTVRNDGTFAYARNFFIKRFTRIWPPYVILTLIVLIFCYPETLSNINATGQWFLESILFYPLREPMPVLKTGWTLNYEMYFYLLFGFSLIAGRWRWSLFGSLIFITLIVVPLATVGQLSFRKGYDFGQLGLFNDILYMTTNPIIWNFFIGVISGLIAMNPPKNIGLTTIRRVGFVFAAILSLMYFTKIPHVFGFFGEHGVIWGLPFGILLFSLSLYNDLKPINVWKPVVFLGNISYSLYITHWPLVEFIRDQILPNFASKTIKHLIALPYLMTILVMSIASYLLLERGLATHLRRSMLGLFSFGRDKIKLQKGPSALNVP